MDHGLLLQEFRIQYRSIEQAVLQAVPGRADTIVLQRLIDRIRLYEDIVIQVSMNSLSININVTNRYI